MVQTTIEKAKRVEEEKAAEIRKLEKEYSKLSQKEIFEKLDEGIKSKTITRAQIIALANVLMRKTDNIELKKTLSYFKERAGDNEDKIKWPECGKFYNESWAIYSGTRMTVPKSDVKANLAELEKIIAQGIAGEKPKNSKNRMLSLIEGAISATDNAKLRRELEDFRDRLADKDRKMTWSQTEEKMKEVNAAYSGGSALGTVKASKTDTSQAKAGKEMAALIDVISKKDSTAKEITAAIDAVTSKLDKSRDAVAVASLKDMRAKVNALPFGRVDEGPRSELLESAYEARMALLKMYDDSAYEETKRSTDAINAILYLDKGWTLGTGDYTKLAGFSEDLKTAKGATDVERSLRKKVGMTDSEAKWYADRIWTDKEFMALMIALPWETNGYNPSNELTSAKNILDKAQTATTRDEVIALMNQIETYSNKGKAERAMMDFAIARRYGDIKNVAWRMNAFFKEAKKGGAQVPGEIDVKGADNIATLIGVLTAINSDREYYRLFDKYEYEGHMKHGLDKLDVVGKYGFIRISYAELLKYQTDIKSFVSYLEGNAIQIPLQFTVFSEILPYLAGHNKLENMQLAVQEIVSYGGRITSKSLWNAERRLYAQGTKVLETIQKTESDFLFNMLDASMENPANTIASNKTALPGANDFKQKEEYDRVYEKITEMAKTNPQVRDRLARMFNVEEVTDPEKLASEFRRLVSGRGFRLVDMQRPGITIGITLDLARFSKNLNDIMIVEPGPEIVLRKSLRGNGSWSYTSQTGQETQASGTQTVELKRWGAISQERLTGELSMGAGGATAWKVGADGSNLYRLGGRLVDYGATLMDNGEYMQLEGFLDACNEDANTFVSVKLVNDQDKTYEAIVYMKEGGTHKKVATYGNLSSWEAANMFGAYAGYNGDARVLFSEGSIKGMVIGYQLPQKIGGALLYDKLTDKEQFSGIVAFSSPFVKVGARVYTDKKGSDQLGASALTKNVQADVAAGTKDDKGVYAINVNARTEKLRISAQAAKNLETLYRLGVDYSMPGSQYLYAIIDYLESQSGTTSYGVLTGASIKNASIAGNKGDLDIGLAWYSEKRTVDYYREDIYTLHQLLQGRKELQDAMVSGDVDNVSDKLKYVNQGLDYVRTAIGDSFDAAMTSRHLLKDGKAYGVEFLHGDSSMFNVYKEAGKTDVKSWRLMGAYGDTSMLEYTQVQKEKNNMACLISAGVLSTEDVNAIASITYGRAYEPSMEDRKNLGNRGGYGWLVRGDIGGKEYDAIATAYLKWHEPFAQPSREYSAVVGRVDYSKPKGSEATTSASIGYGYTKREYKEGGSSAMTYHVIVNGALSKDTAGKIVNAMSARLGVKWNVTKTTGENYTFDASGKYVHASGTDKSGNKIELSLSGYIEQPVERGKFL